MKYLLDTNVISELTRNYPDPNVLAWIGALSPDMAFYSVITLGELRKGIEQADDAKRKAKLQDWFTNVILPLEEQILPVDIAVAEQWGRLEAASPRTLGSADALIAATAIVHGLSILTRNKKDFNHPGVRVIDPWITPVPH